MRAKTVICTIQGMRETSVRSRHIAFASIRHGVVHHEKGSNRVRSVVHPACLLRRFTIAAGPYGDASIGAISLTQA